jgi:hypothetical protein
VFTPYNRVAIGTREFVFLNVFAWKYLLVSDYEKGRRVGLGRAFPDNQFLFNNDGFLIALIANAFEQHMYRLRA